MAIVPESVEPRKAASDLPLQYVKGVGPARAELLRGAGLTSINDILALVPRDWQDRRLRYTLREAPMGERSALRGVIKDVHFKQLRPSLGMAQALIQDSSGTLLATWFKNTTPRYDVFASLRQKLREGLIVFVYGMIDWGPQGRQIQVDDFTLADASGHLLVDDQIHFDRIVPVYTSPEGIPEKLLRSLVARALQDKNRYPATVVPVSVRKSTATRDKTWALPRFHFPGSWAEKEEARHLLAFEEFLILETALGRIRQSLKKETKPQQYCLKRHLLTPFREHMGFSFTEAQKRVIREIFDDLLRPSPMHRLLQGDVGSGKTVVALSAMLLAVENGGQAALMAPTEILAEQHANTIARLLGTLPVRIALLSGRMPPLVRRKALEAIAKGDIDLVIGTHALIQKSVRFSKLMLCVIDEQHRFGVEHRSLLRQKGSHPDVLVMTATPIPRTLALTLYGDLDISTLDQLPPGRMPITTHHLTEEAAVDRIRAAVRAGRQAYIVYPLVEESEKVDLKAVVQEAERLRETSLKGIRVGILHGQLKGKEKESVMELFRQGKLDVLVATSIIEVGIHVPNATVMVIEHAERFGLATLHQLRGRVGRGIEASECLLIADTKTEDAKRRIAVMTQTTDGFRISEEDLSLRGPGEVLGAMQHGIPGFRIGDLAQDAAIIQQAKHAAETLLSGDPELKHPEHFALRQAIDQTYASIWPLGTTA